MNGRVEASILILGLFAANEVSTKPQPKHKPSDYQGCYKVALADWSPRLDGEGRTAVPPAAIELTGVRVEGFTKTEVYWVKPVLGAKNEGLPMSFWSLTPTGQVSISFSTGFVGLGLKLDRKGSALIGVARTFGDLNPGEHTHSAGARADKVACDPKP
jgi:hypothetical protein